MASGSLIDRTLNFDGTATPLKIVLFLLICLAWLLPGLTGHTPWKYDEAVSQGIIHGMLNGGSWLSPTLAGEPYLAHPPLYYWLGAILVRLSFHLVPPHDAARLASGLFMAGTFAGIALAARHLYGPRTLRLAILVFIGSVGLVIRAHEMSTDLSWLMGVSWVVAALPMGRTQTVRGGLMGGIGFGMSFLSQGTLAFPLLLPLLILAPALIHEFRPPQTGRFTLFWAIGAIPFLVIWPTLLALDHPATYVLWKPLLFGPFLHPETWLAADASPLYYLAVSSWFAWPAAPLALGVLWTGGKRTWEKPQTRFLLLMLGLWLIVLGLCTSPREGNALPLLLPFTLLATGGLDGLRRGATSALDWFGMLTFGLLTTLLWLGWIAQMTGWPVGIVHYLDSQLPDFHTHFQALPFAFSLFLTLLWAFTIFHSHPSPRRALINWSVGMTVSWMLVMSLWLPYVEASRSYEGVMLSLGKALPRTHGCVMSTGLGEPQRGLLDDALDLQTERRELDPHVHCSLWLVQSNGQNAFLVPSGWHLRWSAERPGDRNERFLLLTRSAR
ncbi:MAG: hypothetical protein GJU77_00140 [Ferrovum sp.]|nr:hypothetical protein [Ferrovum sp.]NDU90782.1 hypothetical protein [Ferrovum sp.]